MEISPNASVTELRFAINEILANFAKTEGRYLRSIGPELEPVADALERFVLDSGKRLRPLFASAGFLGVGAPLTNEILQAIAALELIHVCALIHDDVMDASDTRRGAPAIHKLFEQMHTQREMVGSAAQFGISSAILLGDLALIWASKALHQSRILAPAMSRALPVYDEMRVELMAGQYLDVHEQALGSSSVERSLRVARYKSGKYTIERPLHFGAALASETPEPFYEIYSAYGLPLGEAFQLRDDVLGVFGDPAATGKPAGDDLREGKRTVLMATTVERANAVQREVIERLFADPDLDLAGVEALRTIIVETGALEHLEALIEKLTTSASESIAHTRLAPTGVNILHDLISIAIRRTI
ncbi:MAG: polyprenyl synthetase family protein [Actinomycetes bacterium]